MHLCQCSTDIREVVSRSALRTGSDDSRALGRPWALRLTLKSAAVLLFLFLFTVRGSQGFSVLTHEAIIDSEWDPVIKPLLVRRFPNATPDDLKNAHAYAYGGAIIQDMGYYPFGNKFFSDLTHYVRSADFVRALIRDSQDLNEYAFALGAVAHYVADNDGHRLAVNRAVPMLYPKLRRKYGAIVVYDQDPAAHLKTEFGFDVLEVAKGHYASEDYHDRIGFQVSQDLLQRAFRDTYSLDLNSVITKYDLAVGTFRYSVSTVIPQMTKVAWQTKKDDIRKETPGITRNKFIYNVSRASYKKSWKDQYRKPGFGTQFLAFLLRIVPKVGPFRALSFRAPTPQAGELFMASFNAAIKDYAGAIHQKDESGELQIQNDNFDTGTVTGPGEYPLADSTYAELVDRLARNHFQQISPELRKDILSYYGNLNAPFATRKHKKEWARVVSEIGELKAASAVPAAATATRHP
ncbi:MAG TPA: zinc dependent phospholipase C family protein [Candidatus Acidoferrales bacterium]|nr:zinc dependent phospholipase C family protein [Candidatus Acidoferrales bacterium]